MSHLLTLLQYRQYLICMIPLLFLNSWNSVISAGNQFSLIIAIHEDANDCQGVQCGWKSIFYFQTSIFHSVHIIRRPGVYFFPETVPDTDWYYFIQLNFSSLYRLISTRVFILTFVSSCFVWQTRAPGWAVGYQTLVRPSPPMGHSCN